jgi:phosphatidylserine/phosphatidylglycerophosphate/cardiolipin synthase-like enzyme
MQTTAHFDRIHETILTELQKAQKSLYVAVAWFTDHNLFQALCRRAAAGAAVELMITSDAINFREGGLRLASCAGRVAGYMPLGPVRKVKR